MITKEQYAQAIQAKQDAEKVIVKFHAEQRAEFAKYIETGDVKYANHIIIKVQP